MLTDSDCSHVREDLIIWVTTRSLYCIFETNIRLFIKDTSTKKKRQSMEWEKVCKPHVG